MGEAEGPYEDLDAFLHRADELALSLREQGITGMKIWPFDPYAEASGGNDISAADLDGRSSRSARSGRRSGSRWTSWSSSTALWNLPTARRIARALEEFEPYWFEDPLRADNLDALATFAAGTHVPVTLSETIATRWGFREVFERGAAGIAMLDVSWCGGISEAKKIATMAEAYQLPVAPHDCTGPIVLMASTHLSINAPNALIQETVRAYYTGWYTRAGHGAAGHQGRHDRSAVRPRTRHRASPGSASPARRPCPLECTVGRLQPFKSPGVPQLSPRFVRSAGTG